MPAIKDKDIARAIFEASKDKTGKELSTVSSDVVKLLARKRLLSREKGILLSLTEIVNEEEGRVVAKVKSARELPESTEKEIAHWLKKRYNAEKVVIVPEVEKDILGGVRIEVNNEIIDLSIKNKITKLQEHLTRVI